jgi:hypothetical protein
MQSATVLLLLSLIIHSNILTRIGNDERSEIYTSLINSHEPVSNNNLVETIASTSIIKNDTGIIRGTVVHVNGTPVSNWSINLESPPGTIFLNDTSDIAGTYAFNHLSLKATYRVSLTYEGVTYLTNSSFINGTINHHNFTVYPTTQNTDDIRITSNQVVIQAHDGSIEVSENIFYENIGLTVFNNSRLNIHLPPIRRDLSSSIMDCCIQFHEGGATFDPMDPILPGEQHRIWTNYFIDTPSSDYVLIKQAEYNITSFHLFVKNTGTLNVTNASQLENGGTITLSETPYTFFVGSNFEAGSNISVTLGGLPASHTSLNQTTSIIVIALAPICFLVAYLISRRKRIAVPNINDLE